MKTDPANREPSLSSGRRLSASSYRRLAASSRRAAAPPRPRVALFRLATLAVLLLLVFVFLSPWLDDGMDQPKGWRWLTAVFARDATVRRTAIGSAVGLFATAWVFFARKAEG